VPWDPSHVVYVWFDALLNYVTAVGWGDDTENFRRRWPAQHLVGKDIARFHAVIWPAVLMGQNASYILPYDIPANEYLTLEGENSELGIATIDPDENYSNQARAQAQNFQWTLPQSNIIDYVGLFRVFANGYLINATWQISAGYEITRQQTTKPVVGRSGWTDLGIISLPPGGYVHPFRYPVRIWLDGSTIGNLDYLIFMPIMQFRRIKFRGYNCVPGACVVDDGIRDELIYDFDGQSMPVLDGWGDPIEIWPVGILPGTRQQILMFAMTNDFGGAEPLRSADVQITVRPRYNVVP